MNIEDDRLYDLIQDLIEDELELGFALEDYNNRVIQGTEIYPIRYNKVKNLILLTCEVGQVVQNINTDEAMYLSLYAKEKEMKIYESIRINIQVEGFIPTKGIVICIEISDGRFNEYKKIN